MNDRIKRLQVLASPTLDDIVADMEREGTEAMKVVQVDKQGKIKCAAIVMRGETARQTQQAWLSQQTNGNGNS